VANTAWLAENSPMLSRPPVVEPIPTLTTNALPPVTTIPTPGNSLSNH
jgi:hypothetical protein